jgi:hypothetical protein
MPIIRDGLTWKQYQALNVREVVAWCNDGYLDCNNTVDWHYKLQSKGPRKRKYPTLLYSEWVKLKK